MSQAAEQPAVILPPTLIGRADLARLVREVETVDNDFEVQKVRDHKAKGSFSVPQMSRSLSDFLEVNKIDVSDDQARMALKNELRRLKDKAPTIRMVFANEAEPEALQELVAWVRQEIHPHALITTGLQPALIGGVWMRTPNHIHDFSVRTLLADKRELFRAGLEAVIKEATTVPTPSAPANVGVKS